MPHVSGPSQLILGWLALVGVGCEPQLAPPMRDASDAASARRDALGSNDGDTPPVEVVEPPEVDLEVIDVPRPARCDAFFNPSSTWAEGFSGQVFFEYDGPPITAWEVRVDFGIALDLRGAWSGSGLLLDEPRLDGTTIVVGARLGAESGQLGVELRRFDIGLTALHASDVDLDPPEVALDQLTCGALE